MVPILNAESLCVVDSHSVMFSPPQNCLKIVALMIPLMGSLHFIAQWIAHLPNFTRRG